MKAFSTLVVIVGMSGITFSQWNSNTAINTSVCVSANDQQDVRIVTDSKGGAIMTWLDFRNDATQKAGDIFVQRIDKNGINKWTANGISLCTELNDQVAPSMTEDGSGGAIVSWTDRRNGNRDIYAQRIDSTGTVKWTTNGMSVAVKAGQQQDAKLISDGAGGAIIVWQDSVNGAWDIYAQRVSSTGAILWAAAGMAVCISAEAQINPRVETDGAGGALIVWQDKRLGLDYDIYAQCLNASGVIQWVANGVAVCNLISTQSNPKIEPDGSGGAVIAWQDKRNGTDYNVYAQRLNASGAVQWTANGVPICTAPASQSAVDMASEGISGAIIAWKDLRSGNYDVYAQKINLAGVVQWTANGIALSTTAVSQLNPNVAGDGSGGAIIAWQDSSLGTSDIKTQRVDGNGIVQWAAGGTAVCNASGDQTSPKNVSDGAGGCIYAWQDERTALGFDIYAHRLLANGTSAGIHNTNILLTSKCFPNPFSSSAFIEVIPPLNWKIRDVSFLLFNVLGEKIEIPFSISENGIHVARGDLESGIYFYGIRTNNTLISQGKLILK